MIHAYFTAQEVQAILDQTKTEVAKEFGWWLHFRLIPAIPLRREKKLESKSLPIIPEKPQQEKTTQEYGTRRTKGFPSGQQLLDMAGGALEGSRFVLHFDDDSRPVLTLLSSAITFVNRDELLSSSISRLTHLVANRLPTVLPKEGDQRAIIKKAYELKKLLQAAGY